MASRVQRRSSSSWSGLVGRWRSSGQTAEAFAGEHGISAARLQWWSSELRRRASREAVRPAKGTHGKPAFAELRVMSSRSSTSSALVEVHARSGLVVRVPQGVDPALLLSVLRAVTQC
jgi:transposase-like protein